MTTPEENYPTLPDHIGGYQHLAPDIRIASGDIWVRDGKPECFAHATIGFLVSECEDTMHGSHIYRKIPVAKQGEAAREHAAANDDAKRRKGLPVATGVLDYFPDAILAVAECSRVGNEQHNPGTPLHWDRSKSGDEADALARHLIQRGKVDTDGVRHSVKVAWRALALLQKELEAAK